MGEMLFRVGGQAVQVFPYIRTRRTRRNRMLQPIGESEQGAMLRIDQGKINLVPFTPTEIPHSCILARSSTSNRQDVETRGFMDLLGVLATLRAALLPAH